MKNVPTLRFKDDNWRDFPAWEEKRLGELYNFKITNSFSRENLNYDTGIVKNIHYGDIHTKFSTLFDITREKVPFINEDISLDKIKIENYCIEGDVIFADASEDLNDVGKSIEVVNLNGEKLLSGLHTLLARKAGDFFHVGFSGYLFKSDDLRVKIQREAQGSKVLSISATRLVNIKISIPSKPEQTKIADFLTAIDDRISQLSQKCDGLAQYKKGVMQKIFSQELRFKDEKGRAFPAWEEKRLGDVADIIGGGTPDTSVKEYWNGNIPWFTPTEIKYKFAGDSVRAITDMGLKNSSAKKLPTGTLLFTSRATVGYVSISLKECTTNQGFQSFVVNSENNNEFIYYWILNNRNLFIEKSSGSTFIEISKKEIEKISIQKPSLKEQEKIAGFLSAVDEKISHAQAQLAALKQYKQGLLQQMFV